jgi:hypothetical protein
MIEMLAESDELSTSYYPYAHYYAREIIAD